MEMMKMNLIQKAGYFAIGTILAIQLVSKAYAQEPKPFGKIAGYYDTRGKSTATLTLGATELPLGTKFFSFMDFATEKENPNNLTAPYSEFRLSKKANTGLGIAAEYNRDFSKPRGVTRVGLIYEPNLKSLLDNTFLGVKFYPASTHNHGMQVGLHGNKSFNDKDITLEGYLDYNLKPKKVVTDLQLGKKINGNLYGVIEGRYNAFMQENSFGAGIGLEWKF